MRTAYRLLLLVTAIIPPLLLLTIGELAAANVIDLCELGCGDPFSTLDFLALIGYFLLTPGLLAAFFATMVRQESRIRTLALVVLWLSFYAFLFAPGVDSAYSTSDAFAASVLLLQPLLLISGLGYLVATARTPVLIVLVLTSAAVAAALLVAARIPAPYPDTEYSCYSTTIVNASSPWGYTDTVACSPYQAYIGGPGFVAEYLTTLTIFACVAALAHAIFTRSYARRRPTLDNPQPADSPEGGQSASGSMTETDEGRLESGLGPLSFAQDY